MSFLEKVQAFLRQSEDFKHSRIDDHSVWMMRKNEILRSVRPVNDDPYRAERALLGSALSPSVSDAQLGTGLNTYALPVQLAEAALLELCITVLEPASGRSSLPYDVTRRMLLASRLLDGKIPLPTELYAAWLEWIRVARVALTEREAFLTTELALQKTEAAPERWESLRHACSSLLNSSHSRRDEANWLFATRDRLGLEPELFLDPSSAPWVGHLRAEVNKMPAPEKRAWIQLMECLEGAHSAEPTAKWPTRARELIATPELAAWQTTARGWLQAFSDTPCEQSDFHGVVNATILKGLGWLCQWADDPKLLELVPAAAQAAYRYVTINAALASAAGNGFILGLGLRADPWALEQLTILKSVMKRPQAQKCLEKALQMAARHGKLSKEEIIEEYLPDGGLSGVGLLETTIGSLTARAEISAARKFVVQWSKADGTPLKTLPAEIKVQHGRELAILKKTCSGAEKLLAAQIPRLEMLFWQNRSWTSAVWRKNYLDHPLVGTLARRLIWRFDGRAAHWLDGRLLDLQGEELHPADSTRVELWQPLEAEPNEVMAWRKRLETCGIVQPFKQAHREQYLLTPAEEQTRVYSNRFAAHLVRQHQLHALAIARGWKHVYSLPFADSGGRGPIRDLPELGLRAEFWAESAGEETADSGVSIHLSTDQVRFYRLRGRKAETDPLPLTEIPRRVFSEIMRDVDLFVGVASVGGDPEWFDGRSEADRSVWQKVAFGHLSATAKTRYQVLESMIPRLKIAKQCSLEDRFFVVQGKLRTYKIHLGSGNILMSPHDQYLCIVSAQERSPGTKKLFLPFEGDSVLSLILSKAFLLATDDKITDPSIVRQIQQ